MNAGPADTHLDLADLVAQVNGQPLDGQARDHLARCQHCQTDARRWDLTARGVRGLAVAPEAAPSAAVLQPAVVSPAAAVPDTAPPARARPVRARVRTVPRRRTLLAAGGAALVAVGGGAYALAVPARSGTPAALTAVTGCAGVERTSGTLQRVAGASLVIKTASGQLVTVTTAASTRVTVAGALAGDIADGATVSVIGSSSDGAVAAVAVSVVPSLSGLTVTPPPGMVSASGTVTDAGSAGFTVVTSTGAKVLVTVSSDTDVVVTYASASQLRTGAATAVVGRAGRGGTLSAAGVVQQPAGSPTQVHFGGSVAGCPPASIDSALAAAFASAS
jgi:hypothetical protein